MSLAINWYDQFLNAPGLTVAGWVVCPNCNGMAPRNGWHVCSPPPLVQPVAGWRCPSCQTVWAPHIEACKVCSKSEINL